MVREWSASAFLGGNPMASRVLRIFCFAAVCGMAVVGRRPVAAFADKPKSPVKSRVTISKATTFFTKPVGKDGYIDYVEALNRHYGKGVTAKKDTSGAPPSSVSGI